MTAVPDPELSAIREALFNRRKIEAIKLYRKATGSGLAEAKQAVEKLEADLRAASPERFLSPADDRGCLGLLLAATLLLILTLLVKASQ